jgi:predicted aconitase with swiveling domain
MAHVLSTRVLVQGNHQDDRKDPGGGGGANSRSIDRRPNHDRGGVYPLLISNIPLSFWGGIDEKTGVVIDTSHPLHGRNVQDTILCLPSGRGSCTASQVLLELILNNKAPRALVLRDRDGLVCVGALIAQSVFPESSVLDVLQVHSAVTDSDQQSGEANSDWTTSSLGYDWLVASQPGFGSVLSDGRLVVGTSRDEVEQKLRTTPDEPTETSDAALSLTSEEREMLDLATTDAERRAVDCLLRYAHIVMDEPTYVPVEKAHIDGCTYIGPGGLHFVQRLVQDGGHVKIPTSLNSVSTDLRHWGRLGIHPTKSQQNSIALANAYLQMGCSEDSFTCAPYLLDDPPQLNQQIVWGESNAVVFANSVLGARTEKYADYLDICCAIVGKVPAVGVHLDSYRKPKILLDMTNIDLECDDPDSLSLLFPVLGHLCGTLSDGEVPLLVGLEQYAGSITRDHLKAFCT